MVLDSSLVIIALLVLVLLVVLWQAKSDARRRDKPPAQNSDAPQFHASGVTPRPENNAPASLRALTRRERDIVRLVRRDLSNDEIARELDISKRTVEKHLENIFRKLEIRSRADLVAGPPDDDKN